MVKKLLLLALAASLITGCASKQDLDNLQTSVNYQFSQQKKVNDKHDDDIRQIYKKIEDANSPIKSTQANLWAENEAMRVKIAQLQGQVEAMQRDLSGVSKSTQSGTPLINDLTNQVKALQSAMTQVTSQLGVEITPTAPGTAAPSGDTGLVAPGAPGTYLKAPVDAPTATPVPAASAKNADTADVLYKKAMAAFQDKKYADAQSMFGEVATNFPKHSLAPNALFWQAESLYQSGDYSRSALIYQDVITKFPKSPKAQTAMLKQGMALYKLGKKDVGKAVLKNVTDKYPGSVEAKRAKEFMKSN